MQGGPAVNSPTLKTSNTKYPTAPRVLLSVSVPAELAQAIKFLREAEGLSICEWMLKDSRVRKWARAYEVALPKPGKEPISRDSARWHNVSDKDWNKGIRHVSNLLGVSRQAVARKKRLLRPE